MGGQLGRDIFEGAYSSAGVRDAPPGVASAAIKAAGSGWYGGGIYYIWYIARYKAGIRDGTGGYNTENV